MLLIDIVTVPKKGLVMRDPPWITAIFAFLVIASCIVPIIIIHCWIWVYEKVYFSAFGIPHVYFRDYLIIDRGRLSKLNLIQKIACVYCGYGNAVAAWLKTVANHTELYSCAIQHNKKKLGQEHQSTFAKYDTYP